MKAINTFSAFGVMICFLVFLYTIPKAIMTISIPTIQTAALNIFFFAWFCCLFKMTTGGIGDGS